MLRFRTTLQHAGAFAVLVAATTPCHAEPPLPPAPLPSWYQPVPAGGSVVTQPAPPPTAWRPSPRDAAPGAVSVFLSSTEPGVGFEVFDEDARIGEDDPIATCPDDCRLRLQPGRYKFNVLSTEDTLGGSRLLDIDGPTRLRFDPDMTSHRGVGLALGIAGPALMLVGVVVIIGSALDGRNNGSGELGALALIGGLTATPIGRVMFGTSAKPEYDLQPLDAGERDEEARFRFGIVPAKNGGLIGAEVSF